ncbi:hypothetical protein PWT90_00096 [Aphanocladium album]|nr:hypothetical protein PWT90_00096 [Aphanocladium album]
MPPTYIEVSQLAPSTSFYAAVLQPLGLRYLTSASASSGPEFAVFGSDHGAVLHLRHVASPVTLQLVSIRISAPSPAAIQAFYDQAVKANPAPGFTVEISLSHSTIFDLDGNKLQAIFTEQASSPNIIKGQFTIILNPHHPPHVGQVLGCDKYTPDRCSVGTMEIGGDGNDTPNTVDVHQQDDSGQTKAEETKNSCGGISAVFGALIGVAAGAAAGAAITYTMMSSNTPDAITSETNERQRVATAHARGAVASAMSTGLVDRDYPKPLPTKSQRIKFEQDPPSTRRKSSTRAPTSVYEKDISQSRGRDLEYDNREQNGNQLVKIPKDLELSTSQPRRRTSPHASAGNAPPARRLAILPPEDSPSKPTTKLIEGRGEHETSFSARTRTSLSSLNGNNAAKRGSELTKDTTSSSTSKRDHSDRSSQNARRRGTQLQIARLQGARLQGARLQNARRRGTQLQIARLQNARRRGTQLQIARLQIARRRGTQLQIARLQIARLQGARLQGARLQGARLQGARLQGARLQGTQLQVARLQDARLQGVRLQNARRRGTQLQIARLQDARLQGLLSRTRRIGTQPRIAPPQSLPSYRRGQLKVEKRGEDRRSRVSARDVPLPASRVGTSEFFDTVSHVSIKKAPSSTSRRDFDGFEDSRSHISARNIPLPASCVDGGGKDADRKSHVSARNIPLPASCVGTNYHDGTRSQVSARNIPLPGSHVGSSRANWDDDMRSIAPSDSISCIGSYGGKAVSVSLPTWKSNVGYEEGEQWVVSRMATGYPRFFIHKSISELGHVIATTYGKTGQQAMLFSTSEAAKRCLDFMRERAPQALSIQFHSLAFNLNLSEHTSPVLRGLGSTVAAALFPADAFGLAKQYWQHTGDGISSRRAEFCHDLLKAGILVPCNSINTVRETGLKASRGPKRYQRPESVDETASTNAKTISAASNDSKESSRFLEERFGRNLDLTLAEKAKSAIRRRIAGSLVGEIDLTAETVSDLPTSSVRISNLSESDIYLFPAGMNAIFNAHRALMAARGQLQSVNFGFPYVDTLKILEKFGPGCIFYGHGSSSDLDDLEERLKGGERLLALFCEFPGNPLLASPDLERIRKLAKDFDFAVVVDETIGTFANVNVLQFADIVVSSLTKIFSGDSNVMGGSAVLNPGSKYYSLLTPAMNSVVEDNYWPEDIIFMERNSRDFLGRVERVNTNAEAICEILRAHPLVKDLFYPKLNPSRENYERCRLPHGGYGGLLSVVFHQQASAQAFYDAMDIAKGPSLGTNFTLCSPYALLAHYNELPWAEQFGVDPNLVRVSVGLEERDALSYIFRKALEAAERIAT